MFSQMLAHLGGQQGLEQMMPEVETEAPLQMLISNLDYDDYLGRICIGRVRSGSFSGTCAADGSQQLPGHFALCRRAIVPHVVAGHRIILS